VSDRGEARTLDQRINLPPVASRNWLSGKDLQIDHDDLAHSLPTDKCIEPPDLAEVVEAWRSLAQPIRAAILALVRTASGRGGLT
jgi:hypothetical protein